jgi:hypothetical protein
MGSRKDRKTDKDILTKAFCDDVFIELEGIRLKIVTMKDELEMTYGKESEPFKHYERHLMELADQIEWKLQILSHACPYDWKGSVEKVENVVSVQETVIPGGPDFSGGYVGG